MKEYDVIVIGAGSGMSIVNDSLNHGLRTALIEKDLLGGTCLNVGCIPSKMLIYPADVVVEAQRASIIGVKARVSTDFKKIMNQMKSSINEEREHMEKWVKNTKELDYYHVKAEFFNDYTIRVGKEIIRGKKIFIAVGARPSTPPIKGLDKIDFLDNESLLELNKQPKSLIIIGGGYIGCEYAHFFASMGTKVTLIQRNKHLVPNEEPEVSRLLTKVMGERVKVITNTEAREVSKSSNGVKVVTNNDEFTAEKLLMAVGRKPNSDLLRVKKTGVKVDDKGFIIVNDYLETSKKNIWAIGDVNGKSMFKHAANEEAINAFQNAVHGKKISIDYNSVPHAVFTHPQIASVGLTEKQAREKHEVLVGKASYNEVAKGEAMSLENGFAKAIINKEDNKVLGFHIIGPFAPILIQEVVHNMASGEDYTQLDVGMSIHPAMPELILKALSNLQ